MNFAKILVPIDFSEFSDKALEYALVLGEKFNSKITLLHIVVLFEDDVDEEERLQEYEEWVKKKEETIHLQMNRNIQKADQHGMMVESLILRSISAPDAILEYLENNSFNLIVMGTHGRTGLKHIFQGSVAEKVVRLSPIPVLTVHRSIQEFKIKNLTVPIDFSIYSKNAADFALTLAKNFHAKVEFLHVIEQDIHPSFYAAGIESIFQIDRNLKDRVIQNTKEFLEDQLDPKIETNFIVREGKAHKEIVEFAKVEGSDLILISTHGLTGLDYLLLGSTTEKVVRWASCPVLTVKSKNM